MWIKKERQIIIIINHLFVDIGNSKESANKLQN